MEKIVAVVFAHNEELNLLKTLDILRWHKFFGRIHEIVVVNDGSTDKTEEVAKKSRVHIVNHKNNVGKIGAFISGANKARELGATIMLNFDADIERLPKNTLKEMIRQITEEKKDMCIARQVERNSSQIRLFNKYDYGFNTAPDKRSNAQRAIRMNALEPLFKNNKKWMQYLSSKRKRINKKFTNHWWSTQTFHTSKKEERFWGLEAALDILIPKHEWINEKVYTQKPFRRTNLDINRTKESIELAQEVAANKMKRIRAARDRLAKIKRNQRKRK